MTVATRIDSFTPPVVTQLSLYEGIKTAFANAGFTNPFDDYTSGTERYLIYAIVLDSSKTYGTTYLRIRLLNNLAITQSIFSTWTVSNHTGTNPSTEVGYTTLANNIQVNFVSLNGGNEYKLIMLMQGTVIIPLGFISPANKPLWWDLNAWNYCFFPISSNFDTWRSTALNPYGNADHNNSLNVPRMGSANPQTNRRDLLPGIIAYTATNQGISGRTSDDLVTVAASGTTRYDLLQIPEDTREYLILHPASGGLAVRVK